LRTTPHNVLASRELGASAEVLGHHGLTTSTFRAPRSENTRGGAQNLEVGLGVASRS
jgi:hypothetical protein